MLRFARGQKLITTSEVIVFSVVVMAALADITTTHFGLQIPGVGEMNPIVRGGLGNGSWVLLEFACNGTVMFVPWVLMRLDLKYKYLFLLGPMIYAVGRFYTAVHNIVFMRGVLFG